ncbi:MAG: biotin/lipoyl-binding protein [Saprospiraceae bacterium]|nr:biotin/lipoyl-binding protein [Saprospiraceae bacterium]
MKNTSYTVKVDEHHEWKYDDASFQIDSLGTGNKTYNVIHNGHSYSAELMSINHNAKQAKVKVNGRIHHITVTDDFDELIKKMGLTEKKGQLSGDIKAPMPGLVLEINVSEGQSVAKGDPLLILEAMKMENIIKAPADGVVSKILVKKGAPVEKGLLLMQIKD